MSIPAHFQTLLDSATVSPSVFALRPDYRALLLMVTSFSRAGSSDGHSSDLLLHAEAHARTLLATHNNDTTALPHISSWRAAYKAFGAKPNKTRNSLEALTRRIIGTSGQLPRVNPLTDVYNAVSVLHQIPFGGEDLDRYRGAPRLVVATGEEEFETTANGVEVREKVEKGEVVWCDGEAVTCRRWNWRQGTRTALTEGSKNMLFILDGLEPVTDGELHAAADELVEHLRAMSDGISVSRRFISAKDV